MAIPLEHLSAVNAGRYGSCQVGVFHWSLVTAFAVAYFIVDSSRNIHEWAGYIALGLVAFCLVGRDRQSPCALQRCRAATGETDRLCSPDDPGAGAALSGLQSGDRDLFP